jgi:uncharacterized protein involved in type VI secretion and phage assembly
MSGQPMNGQDATELPLHVTAQVGTGHYLGVYPATVSDNQDPSNQGRVQVHLPWTADDSDRYEVWARLATMMAGGNRGTWFVPDIGDEVLVCFQGGDPRWPIVIGALWNGHDDPPDTMDSDNNIKAIVSRTGIKITLDDTSGAVTLTLQTPGGQQVTMADAGSSITVEDSNGNSCELSPSGITLTSASNLSISATSANISIPTVNVDSAMWTYSGVVQVETLISDAVVSASYTPGVGNIW